MSIRPTTKTSTIYRRNLRLLRDAATHGAERITLCRMTDAAYDELSAACNEAAMRASANWRNASRVRDLLAMPERFERAADAICETVPWPVVFRPC